MDHETLKAALMQGSEDEAATLFNRILRTVVRGALLDSMAEEVTALCGAKHHPAIDSEHRRAGSESGVAYLGGEKEPITRPRVRSDEGEVQLATYAAASTQRNLYDQVISGIVAGGSIRGVSRERRGRQERRRRQSSILDLEERRREERRRRQSSILDLVLPNQKEKTLFPARISAPMDRSQP